MIFSASNDGSECTLTFGPDSVTLTVRDHVQDMTVSSQEITLAAWSLLLSQRLFEQPSSASSNYPQAVRDNDDEGRSAPKCS